MNLSEEVQYHDNPREAEKHRKALIKLIGQNAHRHSTWEVFSDFCEMAAISISNAVDKPQFDQREARYLQIVKRYSKEEVDRFPQMLGELVQALECGPDDVLGKVFHDLELHNKYRGQFFTPYHLCQMMAMMQIDDRTKKLIEENGFIRAAEPACGSGAMIIALAHAMRDKGINYQQHLHVIATDLDSRCVHMAYLQLSLLHIPAIIQHGNTLSLEEFGRWHTPAHIMGGWERRIRPSSANALLTRAEEVHEAKLALTEIGHGNETDFGTMPKPAEKLEEKPATVVHEAEKPVKYQKPQQLALF